jgi:peptide subunit release factor 1 (eRF1)
MLNRQRNQAIREAIKKASDLLEEGYAVDADRVLEEIVKRVKGWQVPQSGRSGYPASGEDSS